MDHLISWDSESAQIHAGSVGPWTLDILQYDTAWLDYTGPVLIQEPA